MRIYDQICNLILAIIGLGVTVESLRISVWVVNCPGSGFIPFLGGLTLVICGASMFILGRSRGCDISQRKGFWENSSAWRRIAYVLLGSCSIIIFMPILGFALTTIPILILLFRVSEPTGWAKSALVAIFTCVFVHILFGRILGVRLPEGILEAGLNSIWSY